MKRLDICSKNEYEVLFTEKAWNLVKGKNYISGDLLIRLSHYEGYEKVWLCRESVSDMSSKYNTEAYYLSNNL